ncbi:carbohydrate ABC transporter permease [Consotaella aegiceratis]|uniref:carbohydrate ABC transporter permease n=1 Tax=Consotaella aegiceratis TaxID=3097961 RepID=UPI002F40454D
MSPAILLLPAAAIFGVVILGSALRSFWISLHSWDGMGPMAWVGLDNYRELIDDPQFYVSLKNNVIWLIGSMLSVPIGLAIALLINQQIRGMKIVKSLFFMPMVLASVAVGVVFSWVYTPQFGLLALAGSAFGFDAPAVLSDPELVTYAIVGAALWMHVSMNMVLYLAGLSSLDEDLIGAGRVDGARGWTMLRHVIWPQLMQMTFIAVALTAIGALRSFDLIAVMTGGGPFGSSSTLAYQMFEQSIFSYRFGYGAAIAVVLVAIMAIFIGWYLRKIIQTERRV